MGLLLAWGSFVALAAVIGVVGYLLSWNAELVASRTGLGRSLVGLTLVAAITSLPEFIAGFSAVRIATAPDLAVGDVLGSCSFNLALVFVIDILHRETSAYDKATPAHLLSGALGMILLAFVGFALLVGRSSDRFVLGHVGGFSLVIPVLYLLAIRMIYEHEHERAVSRAPATPSDPDPSGRTLRVALLYVGVSAIVILAAGSALPVVATRISALSGWNEAFVGTLFVALATSVPEIAVTIAALRMRAVEMAIGNLLGSNLFNIVILTADDLAYTEGPLFRTVSVTHGVTAFTAVMMTGLVVVALITRPRRRILNTGSALSLLILALYALNAWVVFTLGQ